MKSTIFAVVTCLMALTGAWAADEADEALSPKAITLDAAAQARFGVGIVTLTAASAPNSTTSTARVLDSRTLVQLDSDLAAASASFTASRDDAARIKKAYSDDHTGSYRDVQVAHEREVGGLQKVNQARRQLAMEWGGGVADLQAHSRAELLSDISASRVELARVEIPAGVAVPKPGATLQVRGFSESEIFTGSVLGVLPLVDPTQQTRGVLLKLKGDAAKLPIGQVLSADIPTSGNLMLGVVLPRASLLRHDSRIWVYVQTGATTFVRKEVREYRSVPSGWFVPKGFAPGDHVVAAGASALLGAETP